MFNKSWKQINKENDKLAIKNAKEVFNKLDAKLDDIIEPDCRVEFNGVSYTADLCKHENFTALCPWCKPKSWLARLNDWLENHTENDDMISTKNGFILLLNHALTLVLFGLLIAMFAR